MTGAVVLADANVLFSRVLRDYLMYAALDRIIELHWSPTILDEVERRLGTRGKMPATQAARLRRLMEDALPLASVTPARDTWGRVEHLVLPDEADRHVLAAAVTAGANVLCTTNSRDFPHHVMESAGVLAVTPDDLLHALAITHPTGMVRVHDACTASLDGATSASTLAALERAGTPRAVAALKVAIATVTAREERDESRSIHRRSERD